MLIDGRRRVEAGSSAINQTVFIRWSSNMGSNSYVWSPRRGPAVHDIADDSNLGGRRGRLPHETNAVSLGFLMTAHQSGDQKSHYYQQFRGTCGHAWFCPESDV